MKRRQQFQQIHFDLTVLIKFQCYNKQNKVAILNAAAAWQSFEVAFLRVAPGASPSRSLRS